MMSGKRKSVWKNQAGDEHSRRHCRHSFGDIEEHDGNEAAANGHLVTVSPPTSLSRPSQSPSFHFSLPPKLSQFNILNIHFSFTFNFTVRLQRHSFNQHCKFNSPPCKHNRHVRRYKVIICMQHLNKLTISTLLIFMRNT